MVLYDHSKWNIGPVLGPLRPQQVGFVVQPFLRARVGDLSASFTGSQEAVYSVIRFACYGVVRHIDDEGYMCGNRWGGHGRASSRKLGLLARGGEEVCPAGHGSEVNGSPPALRARPLKPSAVMAQETGNTQQRLPSMQRERASMLGMQTEDGGNQKALPDAEQCR